MRVLMAWYVGIMTGPMYSCASHMTFRVKRSLEAPKERRSTVHGWKSTCQQQHIDHPIPPHSNLQPRGRVAGIQKGVGPTGGLLHDATQQTTVGHHPVVGFHRLGTSWGGWDSPERIGPRGMGSVEECSRPIETWCFPLSLKCCFVTRNQAIMHVYRRMCMCQPKKCLIVSGLHFTPPLTLALAHSS